MALKETPCGSATLRWRRISRSEEKFRDQQGQSQCTTHGTSSTGRSFFPPPPFPPPPPNLAQRPHPRPRPLNGTNTTLSVFPVPKTGVATAVAIPGIKCFGTCSMRGHTRVECSRSSYFLRSRSFGLSSKQAYSRQTWVSSAGRTVEK